MAVGRDVVDDEIVLEEINLWGDIISGAMSGPIDEDNLALILL